MSLLLRPVVSKLILVQPALTKRLDSTALDISPSRAERHFGQHTFMAWERHVCTRIFYMRSLWQRFLALVVLLLLILLLSFLYYYCGLEIRALYKYFVTLQLHYIALPVMQTLQVSASPDSVTVYRPRRSPLKVAKCIGCFCCIVVYALMKFGRSAKSYAVILYCIVSYTYC